MKKKLGLPPNKRLLLSVGNLVDGKGHTYLIDAMNVILKKRNDVILVIIGSGLLEERLRKKVTNLDLNEKIIFSGRKMHTEIPLWMNASDILILPSLHEGFPTVIPEALGCGKPVIGTRVGGIPEAIHSPDIGLLIKPRDPIALADAILDALEKKWNPETIITYAKQYSWNVLVKQFLEIYQQVLLNKK
jgi:glycosyltransferase involved in cell wall biosynthesis